MITCALRLSNQTPMISSAGCRALSVVSVLAFVWISGSASAGVLDLVVDQSLFESISARLIIADSNARDRAEFTYAAYTETMSALEDETQQRMAAAGYHEMLTLMDQLDPFTSREALKLHHRERMKLRAESERLADDPRWERVHQLSLQSRQARLRGLREADRVLYEWLSTLQNELAVDDATMESLDRLIRRRLLEPPRAPGTDFARPVDVLGLYADERLLNPDAWTGVSDLESADDSPSASLDDRINEELLRYEFELDAFLERAWSASRKPPDPDVPLELDSSDPGWAAHERRVSRDWSNRHGISKRAVDDIASLLEQFECGEAAASWRLRFERALCPELTHRRWTDNMVRWLRARTDSTPEQLELATQLQEEYVNGRERLTREAIELGARVRSKRLGALGLESDQLKYAEQLWRLHLHSRRIIRRFADVLTAEQTASLRQALLQTPDRARPLLLGPWIPGPQVLEAIGAIEDYVAPIL